MATKAKSKLEKLWQEFEKTGSIKAYMAYQAIKAKGAKKEAALKSKR